MRNFYHFHIPLCLIERNFPFVDVDDLKYKNNEKIYSALHKIYQFNNITEITTVQNLNVMLIYVSENSFRFKLTFSKQECGKKENEI